MAKIYFTTEPRTGGYQINFLDMCGQRLLWGNPYASVPAAIRAFESEHRTAVYLTWEAFTTRLAKIELDRARLLAWNAWAK